MSKADCLVSVIIVNWNGRSWLEQCLPTLQTQTYTPFEIIIVDNGSTDGSAGWLEEQWPQIKLLPQTQNLGFAAANNIAIRHSQAPYLITLNNDTKLEPSCLAELVAAAKQPDVGMVAAQIVQWQEPTRLDSAGIEVDKAGIGWNRGWGCPVSEAGEETAVFGPSAAAALYKRAMLDEVGLFDEDFFAYYEDVDLAWRGQRAGWRCLYTPKARVHHWHSATANRTPRFKTYLLGRNKVWALVKNFSLTHNLQHLPAILFYDALSLLWQTIQTRGITAVRSRLAALWRLPTIWRKRSETQQAAPLSTLTLPWQFQKRPFR
ncbi:MAG: glycosyltransferase family 2 protein [Chloroflexota bacterium]